MIEVPTPIITTNIHSFERKDDSFQKFKEIISNNLFNHEKGKIGFTDSYSLSKDRIGSMLIYPVTEIRYGIKYLNGTISTEPKKISYLSRMIWILNKNGYIEVIGSNELNKSFLRSWLNNLENELGEIESLSLRELQIERIITHSDFISKYSFNEINNGFHSKRNEYGTDLADRLVNIDREGLDSFNGKIEVLGNQISYKISLLNNKITIFNKIKQPLTWDTIFTFFDRNLL